MGGISQTKDYNCTYKKAALTDKFIDLHELLMQTGHYKSIIKKL